MKRTKGPQEITHKQVEDWLEAQRKRLNLNVLDVSTANYSDKATYTAHVTHDLIHSATFERLEEFAKNHDPEAARLKRISELSKEIEKLKGGEG